MVSALSVEVGLGLPGLYLSRGKQQLVTSRCHLSLLVLPNALTITCLSVVASLLAILPSPTSWFPPVAPLPLLKLVPYCPIIYSDRQTPPRLCAVVVVHYLHAGCPTLWIDVMTVPTVWSSMLAHKFRSFHPSRRSPLPSLWSGWTFTNQTLRLF